MKSSQETVQLAARFRIATLILTYQCPLACRMCFFECNPRRTEVLDADLARRFISDIAKLGIPQIGFAGGEAVLRLDLLCELISQCKALGLIPIVVSSGYWGKSEKQSDRIVGSLRAAGLDNIQLSLDDDHLEFMEVAHFAAALAACKSAGFKNIKIIGTSRGNNGNFGDLVFYVEKVLGVATEGMDLIDRNRVSHGSFESAQRTYTLDYLEKYIRRPDCMSEMMIDVNGDVYPCCQNFIGRIGNLHDAPIETIFTEAGGRSEFNSFQSLGPAQFARRLDKEAATDFSRQSYGSWCEVCARMFGTPVFEDLLASPLSLHASIASFSEQTSRVSLPIIQTETSSCCKRG